MSLRRKLSRLKSAGPGSKAPVAEPIATPPIEGEDHESKAARVKRLRRTLEALQTPRPRAKPASGADALAGIISAQTPQRVRELQGHLPGDEVETPDGPVHLVEHLLEPHHCHGRVPAQSALTAEGPLVARLSLDPSFEDLDLSRMLLIDTETTGLSIGAGTVPFLIGFAYFEDQSLWVRQLFLKRLGDEKPMLKLLAERIRWASCVVSYNGKSFDWPLLRTRYVMNRTPAPPLPPHLDLLHCSRRVFKRRMSSVRLVDMERELLGFVREHDVSGAEIPSIYRTFLSRGEPGRLDGVIEHNAHDLVALASILGELVRRFREVQKEDDPSDHLGYAKVAARAGDTERAYRFATAAAEGGGDVDCTRDAWLLKARLSRKRGDNQ
ncbi:MAG: ribonuclease H-like domain-containing protein, partial [Myxococcota bacterium]